MDDRELLELAAKAADIFVNKKTWPYSCPIEDATFFDEDSKSITGTRLWFSIEGEVGGTEEYTWNPLNDDGDAFRLAVRLQMQIDMRDPETHLYVEGCAQRIDQYHKDNDPYAATRRAIVRAAAEIGRAM